MAVITLQRCMDFEDHSWKLEPTNTYKLCMNTMDLAILLDYDEHRNCKANVQNCES